MSNELSAAPAALEVRHLQIDDLSIRIAIRKAGDRELARTPLLLLNGIGLGFEMLLPLVDALPDTDIILFDVPGCGQSSTPSLPLRMSSYAGLCARILDELNTPQVNILGFSWGGILAQEFVRQFPNRCERLIIAASNPGHISFPAKPSVLWKLKHALPGSLFADRSSLPSVRGYLYQVMAVAGWSSLPWLHRIRQPTIVMHGTKDPLTPALNARLMARLIPGAKLVLMNCGHLFVMTQPAKVADIARRFFFKVAEREGFEPSKGF